MEQWILVAADRNCIDKNALHDLVERLKAKILDDSDHMVLVKIPEGIAQTVPEYDKTQPGKYSWSIQPVINCYLPA